MPLDGTVLTGKFCVGVLLNIQSIYLSTCLATFSEDIVTVFDTLVSSDVRS